MEEIQKFSEMDIRKEIKAALEKMGFEGATPIQAQAIPAIMTGNDFIGIAQTGTGKTCAFGIPAIEKVDVTDDSVQVLILCPTRELVIQTGEELLALSANMKGIKITTIYGGQQIDRQIIALKKKPQIIVGTPGRIMDHMRRKTIKFDNISMIVLDEADEMLNMGFREDLDVILEKANEDRQTVLLSATMSKEIMTITKKYQKANAVKVEIKHKTLTAPKIAQFMVIIEESKKIDALTRILDSEDINLSVIFCNTKRKVDELEEHLRLRGFQVDALHGDMKQSQRDIVMKRFRSGKTNILVATDVAARGIDVDDVEVIFNYDMPTDEEYYVHRIGRTGRAGKSGRAITFITPREKYKLKFIENYTNVKMELYDIPSAKSLNEKKRNKVLENITNEIAVNDLSEEISIVENYINENEISAVQLAAVLLKMKFDKNNIGKKVEDDFEVKKEKSDSVRLFITLGKMDNLKRQDLKEYLVKDAKISKSDIYDTEVLDKFSFVTTNSEAAEKIIKNLNETKYNGRRVAVEISVGEASTSSRNRRSDRFSKESRSSKNEFGDFKKKSGNFKKRR